MDRGTTQRKLGGGGTQKELGLESSRQIYRTKDLAQPYGAGSCLLKQKDDLWIHRPVARV